MADRKISQFTAATEFQAADDIPLVRGATNLKGKISLLAQAILAINGSGGTPVAPTDFKDSVLVATTANITLSGEQTIDGTLTNASRVLVWFQTNAAQNGLYLSAAGAWTRTTDADANDEVTPGMLVVVEAGATYANVVFTLATAGAIVVGTTPLTFAPVVLPTVTFPVKTVNQTTYSHLLLDSGRRLVFTNAATKTFTVASFTGGGGIKSAVNTEIDGFNAGAGALTIAPAGGVTINAASLVVPQYGYFKLKKRANPNEWDLTIVGGGLSTGTANVFTKSQTIADFALTDAATVAIDYAQSNSFFLQLTAAIGATRALGMPTNPSPGANFNLRVKQPASGGPCVLTYPAGITWGTGGAGAAPTLSTTANAVDVLGFVYDAGTATWRGSMISTASSAGLASTNVFTKSQSVLDVALVDAATVALDYALSNNFTLLLTSAIGGTRALGTPTNPTPGAYFNLRVKQPASGGPCVLTYPPAITWGTGGAGAAPTLSTTANAVDVLGFVYDAGTATWRGSMIATSSSVSLAATNVFTKSNTVADFALTDAATVALDYANSNNFYLLLTSAIGATRALGTPANPTSGAVFNLKVKQPASGGPCALTWPGVINWGAGGNGAAPAMSTNPGAVDVFGFVYDAGTATWRGVMIQTGGGAPMLGTANVYSKSQTVQDFALTDAATIAIDYANSNNFFVLLSVAVGGTRAMGTPANPTSGAVFNLKVKQPASGGPCVITWPVAFDWGTGGAGAAPTLSTTPGAVDVLGFVYDASTSRWRGVMINTGSLYVGSTTLSNTLLVAAGVVNIDCALGDYFTLTLTANVTSITFTNLPGAGRGCTKWIDIIQGAGPYTVAWPASFKWEGGVAGAVSTANGATDALALTTLNNGTTWKATLAKAWA